MKLISKIDRLSRIQKQFIIGVADVVSIVCAIWVSFSLRLGELYFFEAEEVVILLLIGLGALPIFLGFGLYRAIIRYVDLKMLWAVFKAVSLVTVFWSVLALLLDFNIPHSVILIAGLFSLLFVGGSRLIIRSLISNADNKNEQKKGQKNILIYGAGKTGIQLAKALEFAPAIKVIGFIDDKKSLQHKQILGLNVYSFESIEIRLKEKNQALEINEVLLASLSLSRVDCMEIEQKLAPYSVQVRVLPNLSDLAKGKVNVNTVRVIDIADLLGRPAVKPNTALLNANIREKVVLVTGAGGSIGSELCRQIMTLGPNKLILFDHSELAVYQMEGELLGLLAKVNKLYQSPCEIVPILGSVVDQKKVERICKTFGVQTIYHAAAYKHVPMVEKNINEGIKNNIFGTFRCAQAAVNMKVETFVLISTDKAVRPTNTMGATKRFAELILQGLSKKNTLGQTRFTMVRFGNVLGSSGSVIPLFKKQIKQGGPVTVTDPEITRYFMTIPEAAQLVIQAGAMGEGGDVFVLDMGKSVKIVNLAKRLIHLSGYEVKDENNPKGDIEITYVGLRPGEKLYEELLIGDKVSKTEHKRIMRAEEEVLSWHQIEGYMKQMQQALIDENEEAMRNILECAITGFIPQCEVVDVLMQKKVA